jgi:ubiquinone biosynthesis protein COQ4
MTRYRESHDLIHTILGMPTNMLGEVAVKWVEALNIGLPMCYGGKINCNLHITALNLTFLDRIGAIFGALRLKPKHRQLYQKYFLPWSIETGRQLSQPLLNVYWEKRWNQDINEIRDELNIKKLQIKF